MAADLHIHALVGATEKDLSRFFVHTMGSKYFDLNARHRSESNFKLIEETPNIWIGEVSWLKAGLTGDNDTYIPATVFAVHDAIKEDLPSVDESLIGKIAAAFNLPNKTNYKLNLPSEVEKFLRQHMGERLFTVSW